MCAAPARTSDHQVIAAASAIVADRGADGLSLRQLASAVGVKAPSLYKRFADRRAVLRAVREGALTRLVETLKVAASTGPPGAVERLGRMARAYRRFARHEPGLYNLLFEPVLADPDASGSPFCLDPVAAAFADLLGPKAANAGTLAFIAFLHGFAVLDASRPSSNDGDDGAFAFGLTSLLDGLAAPIPRA